MNQSYPFIPYKIPAVSPAEMITRSYSFYQWLSGRRTVREFSNQPVPPEVIDTIILTASTAPSGAHKQPWTFCVVSNKEIKRQIRMAAEEEEKQNYSGRMSEEWIRDLAPLGTTWHKPFLETAPYLIVVFKRTYELEREHKHQNYYVQESVGIACGFLLASIYNAGLAALTHTPSPMNFLCKILNRPDNEKPYLLIPVGYVAENATVPDLTRKTIDEIRVNYS